MLTFSQLKAIARKDADEANIRSIVIGLDYAPTSFGLRLPHRYIHFAAQVAHESGRFKYDEELWGPTPAQKRYDLRADLGNTTAADGDGFLYRGRTGMQATGKSNYQQFTNWCKAQGFQNVPDFVKNPDLINTDPWEGLFPIFYWHTRKLNGFADVNDIEMITRRINGGLNGFEDRVGCYETLSLIELDFPPTEEGILLLQAAGQKKGFLPADTKDKTQLDGVFGPKTRGAAHEFLVLKGKTSGIPTGQADPVVTAPAPVVVEKEVVLQVEVPIPVIPAKAEKTLLQRITGISAILAAPLAWFGSKFANLDQTGVLIVGGVGVLGAVILFWRGEMIARRAKVLLKELDS